MQQELQQQQAQLKEQLATALALERSNSERQDALEKQLVQLDAELRDYTRCRIAGQRRRASRSGLQTLAKKARRAGHQFGAVGSSGTGRWISSANSGSRIWRPQQQHRQIEQRRHQRIDQEGPSPGWPTAAHPLVGPAEFALDNWPSACRPIRPTAASCWSWTSRSAICWVKSIRAGLTSISLSASRKTNRSVGGVRPSPAAGSRSPGKKVRSAVVNVAACLRELRDGLLPSNAGCASSIRKISGRQLSDLAVFKIEPEDETILVEAIELLISIPPPRWAMARPSNSSTSRAC